MKNNLKQALKSNQISIGTWITIGHLSMVEILLTADFDWFAIDLEHSVINLETTQQMISTINQSGKSSLVRVSKNEEVVIKRVMDAGATGVIIPMVCSKEDAQKAINYVKYPPVGKRGVGLARAQKFGIGFEEYRMWLKEESVIICQIEHINGVKNLKDILSLNEVDGIIIGPYDLSASLGKPGQFEDKEVMDAIRVIEEICKELDKPLGMHVIPPDHIQLNDKIRKGYSFLGFSLDFLFLGEKAREEVIKIIRK
ncbi:MAG: aldolase/citrate lyase family protein [Bacteroidota bacterium]